MPILKFWDGTKWDRVGGADVGEGYVPLIGGTVSGDLYVDAAEPWDAQVITEGTIAAGVYKGVFDGNIRFTGPRTVDFGHYPVVNVGSPQSASDAVTKVYVDNKFASKPVGIDLILSTGWQSYGDVWGGPRYRMSGTGRTVVLDGLVKALTTIVPGNTSLILGTLPVGYRPRGQAVFAVMAGNNTLYTLNIFGDGRLQLFAGSTLAAGAYVSLNGVRFPAA